MQIKSRNLDIYQKINIKKRYGSAMIASKCINLRMNKEGRLERKRRAQTENESNWNGELTGFGYVRLCHVSRRRMRIHMSSFSPFSPARENDDKLNSVASRIDYVSVGLFYSVMSSIMNLWSMTNRLEKMTLNTGKHGTSYRTRIWPAQTQAHILTNGHKIKESVNVGFQCFAYLFYLIY